MDPIVQPDRLLFTGQFLSIIGDRVTSVVLPFVVGLVRVLRAEVK